MFANVPSARSTAVATSAVSFSHTGAGNNSSLNSEYRFAFPEVVAINRGADRAELVDAFEVVGSDGFHGEVADWLPAYQLCVLGVLLIVSIISTNLIYSRTER